MDGSELILTEAVSPPTLLEHLSERPGSERIAKLESEEVGGFSDEQKERIAKDFESVLIGKLLDEMKDTIGEWGFEKDGASRQVQGMFWLYLSQELANSGGFGLWKDIYDFLVNSNQTKGSSKLEGGDSILL
jgi:Rod binding domain-containing protein